MELVAIQAAGNRIRLDYVGLDELDLRGSGDTRSRDRATTHVTTVVGGNYTGIVVSGERAVGRRAAQSKAVGVTLLVVRVPPDQSWIGVAVGVDGFLNRDEIACEVYVVGERSFSQVLNENLFPADGNHAQQRPRGVFACAEGRERLQGFPADPSRERRLGARIHADWQFLVNGAKPDRILAVQRQVAEVRTAGDRAHVSEAEERIADTVVAVFAGTTGPAPRIFDCRSDHLAGSDGAGTGTTGSAGSNTKRVGGANARFLTQANDCLGYCVDRTTKHAGFGRVHGSGERFAEESVDGRWTFRACQYVGIAVRARENLLQLGVGRVCRSLQSGVDGRAAAEQEYDWSGAEIDYVKRRNGGVRERIMSADIEGERVRRGCREAALDGVTNTVS